MNRHLRGAIHTLPALLLAASFTTNADDSAASITWSTGLEFSSGSYGGSGDIEDLYVPMKGRVEFGRVSFDLTVPYLSVRAPAGTTVTEPGGEPVPGSGETVTESGMGDVIAGVTIYDVLYSDELGIALDLAGRVKFGTADEAKGLGTGENDYTIRADVYKFFEQFTLLASGGYKFRGEPADIELEDVWLGSVGGVLLPSERSSFGVIYDYRESALVDGDAISELSVFMTRQFTDRWNIQFYAFTGFSDSSPDRGAGVQFTAG